jgi:imidazolonepropionase
MTDLGIIEDGSVLIRNTEIAAVGPTRRIENLREARNASVIPATGRIVLPGFVDPILGVMLGTTLRGRETSVSRLAQEAQSVLRLAMQHGTTRAEVKAGGPTTGDELRSLRRTHRLDPHRETLVPTWLVRASADEPRGGEAVAARAATFDYVQKKLPGAFLDVESGAGSQEGVADLLKAATERKIPCKLIWQGEIDKNLMDLMSQFPIHALSGLKRLDLSAIPELAKSQTMLVIDIGDTALSDSAQELRIRDFLDRDGGLALATGYDPVRSPMFNVQMAIALAVLRLGMTTEEAITAATINAAYASGIASTVGSLEYGKDADLLMLNLTDYRDLPRQFGMNHVGLVLRAGAVVFNRIGWKAPSPK